MPGQVSKIYGKAARAYISGFPVFRLCLARKTKEKPNGKPKNSYKTEAYSKALNNRTGPLITRTGVVLVLVFVVPGAVF